MHNTRELIGFLTIIVFYYNQEHAADRSMLCVQYDVFRYFVYDV